MVGWEQTFAHEICIAGRKDPPKTTFIRSAPLHRLNPLSDIPRSRPRLDFHLKCRPLPHEESLAPRRLKGRNPRIDARQSKRLTSRGILHLWQWSCNRLTNL